MPSLIDKSGNIAYFGRLSWGNFFDWLVTLCLGAIIVVFTISLGGVRADTHVLFLPLFVALTVLHFIWLAVDDEVPKRLSQVPLFFVPFIVWAVFSIYTISPVSWLGRIELIYGLEAFIFLWVMVNNVRTRAHLFVTIVMALVGAAYALLIGVYQFLQSPNKIVDSWAEHGIQLSPEFLGSATGSFADPNSFAVFLLMGLPALLIAGLVPKLPMILRIFSIYVALMFLLALAFTQLFWPIVVLSIVLFVVPVMAFRELKKRLLFPFAGLALLAVVAVTLSWLHPQFSESLDVALSPEGEAIRLDLWAGSLQVFKEAPVLGAGGGAFATVFSQSADVRLASFAQTPHNDFLLLLVQYGLVGCVLLVVPLLYVLFIGVRRWKIEPSRVRLKERKGLVMPPHVFLLSIGLAGFLMFICCAFFSFVVSVPALLLCGMFFFSIMIKSSTNRRIRLPRSAIVRVAYIVVGGALAWAFYSYSMPRLQAQATELEMRQRLDNLVEQRVHLSGNENLLLNVIARLEEAAQIDPSNADVWIGLSAAHAQRYYQNPSDFEAIAAAAIETAQRALEISDGYAVAWAQLGIAYALSGNSALAEPALLRALEMAPNDSLMHYYVAAFLSNYPERREAALQSVNQALEINASNAAARRLQQKLLIL